LQFVFLFDLEKSRAKKTPTLTTPNQNGAPDPVHPRGRAIFDRKKSKAHSLLSFSSPLNFFSLTKLFSKQQAEAKMDAAALAGAGRRAAAAATAATAASEEKEKESGAAAAAAAAEAATGTEKDGDAAAAAAVPAPDAEKAAVAEK
jgi:hypothetical protein